MNQKELTPLEHLEVLRQVVQHPSLALNFHSFVAAQQALDSLQKAVTPENVVALPT